MCTGWRYHCLCSQHQTEPDGLMTRYKRALANRNFITAVSLRKEIDHITNTMGTTSPIATCDGTYICTCQDCQSSRKRLQDHRLTHGQAA